MYISVNCSWFVVVNSLYLSVVSIQCQLPTASRLQVHSIHRESSQVPIERKYHVRQKRTRPTHNLQLGNPNHKEGNNGRDYERLI